MEKKVLSAESFKYLQEHEPEFLRSYYILSNFYVHLTEHYTHKVWKDGRLVLTPYPSNDEENNN